MFKSDNVKTKLTILQRRDCCVGPEAVREQGAVGRGFSLRARSGGFLFHWHRFWPERLGRDLGLLP